ncbi:hypothetical protein H6H03_29220 [Nostoc paludosum FACHB-159]|uniref:Uncharacterized protein n=1 Tax=Nostoc paludosum FACHB-159 TaxID=2692908 RepID=A0ABR8KIP6_9NOSO|nr:hypothetical protein [Nostoc paludosum]MBD2681464.1 hypothetical protein [Nostoc sp. FACHB-857]MBD2737922.1 hypothetical protein [Nostoc paludosum FACHB-159]
MDGYNSLPTNEVQLRPAVGDRSLPSETQKTNRYTTQDELSKAKLLHKSFKFFLYH